MLACVCDWSFIFWVYSTSIRFLNSVLMNGRGRKNNLSISISYWRLEPSVTGNILLCDFNLCYIYHYCRGNISLRFSSNFEANASELLENLEEMFPRTPAPIPVKITSRDNRQLNIWRMTQYSVVEDWNQIHTHHRGDVPSRLPRNSEASLQKCHNYYTII